MEPREQLELAWLAQSDNTDDELSAWRKLYAYVYPEPTDGNG